MRQRRCNSCETWASVDEWAFGCPNCGHGNGRNITFSEYPGVEIIPDIKPYKSMIDGSEIASRSKHKAHLKQHGCIEIGNEVKNVQQPLPDVDPKGRRELIAAQIQAFGGHDKFMAAKKREIDNIKWNSRK